MVYVYSGNLTLEVLSMEFYSETASVECLYLCVVLRFPSLFNIVAHLWLSF